MLKGVTLKASKMVTDKSDKLVGKYVMSCTAPNPVDEQMLRRHKRTIMAFDRALSQVENEFAELERSTN